MIVVVATQNKNKVKEINAITSHFGFKLKSLEEVGLVGIEVEEDGYTFEANSYKKADEICKLIGLPTIADDSGLMVDALSGAPGVYSARFAGEKASDLENNLKLLKLMEQIPEEERGAQFISVITMVFPDGEKLVARGKCRGKIIRIPLGDEGFGYDPLFVPEGYLQTFGELSSDVKNSISHRADALKVLKDKLDRRGVYDQCPLFQK